MKKLISIILAIACLLTFVSCNPDDGDNLDGWPEAETEDTAADDTSPKDTEQDIIEEPSATPPAEETDLLSYLSITYGEDYNSIKSLIAYCNGDGTVHVEYVGEYKKVGDLDASIEEEILAALNSSGLKSLNGMNQYEDGEANGSLYVSFKDGTSLSAGFSGNVPEEYISGYETMDGYFQALVDELPIYVPKPLVEGNIHEDDLLLIESILENADLEYIDSYVISEVPLGEYFTFQMGLSDDEEILRGVTFGPMMMTTPYSLAMVVVEDGEAVNKVCKDFENNINWRKWVCVSPTDCMIATKGQVVICLLGSSVLFTQTSSAIEAAGFDIVKTFKNPDMSY